MRLLSGSEEKRLDVELDILSPGVFTGVYPWPFNEEKTENLNIYPFATSVSIKNPDAILLGPPSQGQNYMYQGQAVKAYGTFQKPDYATEFLNAEYTAEFKNQSVGNRFDSCRGWEGIDKAGWGDYNFYHAFHPFGYMAPPFGELVSLSEYYDEFSTVGAPVDNGSCADITNDEYMQMRGIVSVNTSESDNLLPVNDGANRIISKINPIHSPYEECPPDLQPAYYFEEILFRQTAGTYDGGVVGNPYNHQPFPTSLDFSEMTLTNRYNIQEEINGDGARVGKITEPGIPAHNSMVNIANYGTGEFAGKQGINNDLTLNNKLSYRNLCNASRMEGGTAAGVYVGGSLDLIEYDPASPLNAGSLTPTFNYNPWYYWNFTYKENHDLLPFVNNFNDMANSRGSSRGTLLLLSKKADTDHWWENRQCPETVDFLPWTVGGTIHDCPRDYFEVPYYSAIGKFGYYGARFQATCKTLQRAISNDTNGVKGDGADGVVPVFEKPYPLTQGDNSMDSEVDKGGAISNRYFKGLLEVAEREQAYSEWFVNNKAPKLAHNYALIQSDPEYALIIADQPKFEKLLYSLVQKVDAAKNNLPNFLNGLDDDNPYIKVDNSYEEHYEWFRNDPKFGNSNLSDIDYTTFYRNAKDLLNGDNAQRWETVLDRYGYFFKTSQVDVDWEAYQDKIDAQEKRLRTRGMLNIVQGNPIDLYPTNHITYSFDHKNEYLQSDQWGRLYAGSISSSDLNGGLELPEVERRYFEGTYTKRGDHERLVEKIEAIHSLPDFAPALDVNPDWGYSDGGYYKNIACGATLPKPSYEQVTDGEGVTQAGNPNAIGLVNNWMMLGFNEIGKINGNFSCFTPVFVQQPKSVYCKLGQHPTMRAIALDYHTIPEDKIHTKHPEIWFWAQQLKMLDNKQKYLYPMEYRWGRVAIADVEEFMKGDFDDTTIEWASNDVGSTWGGLEGTDESTLTFIHPDECVSTGGDTGYFGESEVNYSFIQGVKSADCTEWAYFCLAYGRFGVRCSDVFIMEADEFTMVDIAYINGGGASIIPNVSFKLPTTVNNGALQDGTSNVSLSANPDTTNNTNLGQSYAGLKNDNWIVPEEVIVKQRFMRAGGGQNVAYGFNGGYQWRGFLRSYAPETLEDTRGLRSQNHQPVEYGLLVNYKIALSDKIGGYMYGYSHLPVCANSQMSAGQEGIRLSIDVDGDELSHPLVSQPAQIGMTSPPAPMNGNKPDIEHIGQLYNHQYPTSLGVSTSWQFHQNMGAVKRFGSQTRRDAKGKDYVFVNDLDGSRPGAGDEAFNYVRDEIVTSTDLAGPNCGYTPVSVGRKMLYYVEAFERFYVLCDSKAKYNVPNKSFIAPGLRFGDAPMQYAWFGQPSDTYLERKSMYGPYAFQWKVKRHNRDRLGNGISQGFWSMGWREKYSLMYDVAAVYGLYMKNTSDGTKRQVDDINTARQLAYPNQSPPLRRQMLGRRGTRAEGYGYGNVRLNCEAIMGFHSTRNILNGTDTDPQAQTCAYFSLGQAHLIKSNEYYCGLKHIHKKACFDPCLSIRYSHGFMPGGKNLSHMSAGAAESPDGGGDKKVTRITSRGEHTLNGEVSDAHSLSFQDYYADDQRADGKISMTLRGPANNPYAAGIKQGTLTVATPFTNWSAELNAVIGSSSRNSNRTTWSVSPCEPGGADHCNYLTPTVHLGGNLPLTTQVTSLTANNNAIANSI